MAKETEKMSWVREILGYILILTSLYGIYLSYFVFYRGGLLVESIGATVLTVITLRAGVQLLKVAICARIASRTSGV